MKDRRAGAANPRPGAPSFRGLGPTSLRWLAAVGIDTPQQLAARDPFEVYAAVKALQPKASLNLLYALIGAVEDRSSRDVARRDRTRVLMGLQDRGVM